MAYNINTMNQNSMYNMTKPDIKKEWSALSSNQTISGTNNCGYYIPLDPIYCIPSEKHRIEYQGAFQFTPFIQNIMQSFEGKFLSYFVPYRVIVDKFMDEVGYWEDFITGGVDGVTDKTLPTFTYQDILDNISSGNISSITRSLWDSLCYPTFLNDSDTSNIDGTYDFKINKLAVLAYNEIYNEILRFPDFEDAVDLDSLALQKCHWQNDYFTRARRYQQRGVTPLLPVTPGTLTQTLEHHGTNYSTAYPDAAIVDLRTGYDAGANRWGIDMQSSTYPYLGDKQRTVGTDNIWRLEQVNASDVSDPSVANMVQAWLPTDRIQDHNVSLSVNNVSINLNELLLDMSIMRYQINNARMQPRYTDQLQARFGIYPEDARLDRPEYIGSSYINISTEGVTNTSGAIGSSAPQGKITSQAWGVSKDNKPLTYEVKEHGLIMTVFYVRPASVYDGVIPKQALASSRFDFPTPELANTPDVPILRRELSFLLPTVTYPDSQNDVVMGWTDIYSEYRTRLNKVCGLCRPSDASGFKNNLARFWTHSEPPELNVDLIRCTPDMVRIKQYTAQPDFIYFVRQSVSTAQPLPIRSEPALLGNI